MATMKLPCGVLTLP